MTVLRLFGVEWSVEGGQIRPPYPAGLVKAPLSAFGGQLQDGVVHIAGVLTGKTDWRLDIDIIVPIKRAADDAWVPTDGSAAELKRLMISPPGVKLPATPAVNIWLGGGMRTFADVGSGAWPLRPTVRQNEVWLLATNSEALKLEAQVPQAPFAWKTTDTSALTLDLPNARVVCAPAFFQLTAGIRAAGSAGQLHTATILDSQRFEVDFGSLPNPEVRRFLPRDPKRPLPIAASALDTNTFQAPLTLSEAALELTFSPTPSGAALTDLTAVPGTQGAAWAISAHRLRNRRNQPLSLGGRTRCPLSYRPADTAGGPAGTPAQCGSLLLRPGSQIDNVTLSDKAIHTELPGTEFVVPDSATSTILKVETLRTRPLKAGDLRSDDSSFAWLSVSGSDCSVITSRPGVSYKVGGSLSRLKTVGGALALPLVGNDDIPPGLHGPMANFRTRLDQTVFNRHRVALPEAEHETGFIEKPAATQNIPVRGLLGRSGPGTSRDSLSTGILLDEHEVVHDYGLLAAKFLRGGIPQNKATIEYGLINSVDQLTGNLALDLDTLCSSLTVTSDVKNFIGGANRSGSKNSAVLGIVKYGHKFKLRDIIEREGIDLTSLAPVREKANGDLFSKLFDEVINDSDWVGLVIFNVSIKSAIPQLRDVLPDDPRALYVAIRPGAAPPSVNARLWWQDKSAESVPARTSDDQESVYHVKEIDVRIRDSALNFFYLDSELKLDGFFGRKDAVNKNPIAIRGRFERTENGGRVRVGGAFESAVKIFDSDLTAGPIANVSFKGAELVASGDSTRISVDGDVALRKVSLGNITLGSDGASVLHFLDLGLELPQCSPSVCAGRTLRRLAFSYPSLRFDFDGPRFTLWNSIRVALSGIGFDWKDAHAWDGVIRMVEGDWSRGGVYFDLKFEFGQLPELAFGGLSKLNLGLRFGCRRGDDWGLSGQTLAISALDFKPFKLGLLRFLEVGADSLTTDPSPGPEFASPLIRMQNAYIDILGKRIVTGLSAGFGQRSNGARAFYIADNNPKVPDAIANLFRLEWILIGREVSLNAELATKLLAIPTPATDDNGAAIRDALDKATTYLFASDEPPSPWLFAAGISVLDDFLKGRVLLQEGRFYGASLWGKELEELLGWELAITALYIKRARGEEDSFYLSMTVPRIAIGTIQFTGGVIDFEIFCNSDFMFDAGFPHLQEGGGRAWQRALGAIVTPFQGSGGFYLAKRTTARTSLVGANQKFLRLSAGYAVQAGLGATFGAGIITAWVTVGVYAIAEGDALLRIDGGKFELWGIALVGAVGVLVRGGAELDFWIISVRLEVVAQAEARLTLAWGEVDLDRLRVSGAGEVMKPDGQITLSFAFDLYFHASARACIGGGPFRLCKEVAVTLAMPVKHTLHLAKT